MPKEMKAILALAKIVAIGQFREPVVALIMAGFTLFSGFLPFAVTHELGVAGKIGRDGGLSCIMMGSFVLIGFCVAFLSTVERRRTAAETVFSKMEGMWIFGLGTYLGLLHVAGVFVTAASASFLASSLAGFQTFPFLKYASVIAVPVAALWAGFENYRSRSIFSSCFIRRLWICEVLSLLIVISQARFGSSMEMYPGQFANWVAALALILASSWVAVGFAVFASVFRRPASIIVFIMLISSGFFTGYLAENQDSIHSLVPDWQLYWIAEFIRPGYIVTWRTISNTWMYSALLSISYLLLAVSMMHVLRKRAASVFG